MKKKLEIVFFVVLAIAAVLFVFFWYLVSLGKVEFGIRDQYPETWFVDKGHYTFLGDASDDGEVVRYLNAYYVIGDVYINANPKDVLRLYDSEGHEVAWVQSYKDGSKYHNAVIWLPDDREYEFELDKVVTVFYMRSDEAIVNGEEVEIEKTLCFDTDSRIESVSICEQDLTIKR